MLVRRLLTRLNSSACSRYLSGTSEGVDVETAHDERTVILKLRNKGRMNCMTESLASQFKDIVTTLSETYPKALCLIITGDGGSFAAGADLDWLEERTNTDPEDNIQIMKDYYAYFTPLVDLPIPTIAAINGPAVGAGFCCAMLCDMRVTSADSKLGANFVKLGISPGMGGTFTFPLKLSSQVAHELLLTGRILTGKEAYEKGIVMKCTETKDQVLPESLNLALHIVSSSPIAIKETVQLLRSSHFQLLQAQLGREAAAQARCFAATDIRTGLKAVRSKKQPVFD